MTHISASQQRRKVQLNFATASRTSGNCVIKMVSRFLFDAFRVDYFRVGHLSTDDSIKGSNKLNLLFVLKKLRCWAWISVALWSFKLKTSSLYHFFQPLLSWRLSEAVSVSMVWMLSLPLNLDFCGTLKFLNSKPVHFIRKR